MERLLSTNKVVGIKQTRNSVIDNRAKVVYIAEDTAPDMLDGIVDICKKKRVELVFVSSRRELARICKVDVPCAAAAVLNDNNK